MLYELTGASSSLHIQSTLVISKLKHFEISVVRHIRFSGLKEMQIAQLNFTNEYVIETPSLRNIY